MQLALSLQRLKRGNEDSTLSIVRANILCNNFSKLSATKGHYSIRHSISIVDNIFLFKNNIPASLQEKLH